MIKVSREALEYAFGLLADRFPMSVDERAAFVEHHLMCALRGNVMQGIGNLEYLWVRRLQEGRVHLGARLMTVVETGAAVVVDADGMLGMLAGKLAMQLAVAKAKEVGIGLVLVRNSTDWGAGGYCVVHALPHGCVGHALANSRPEVAPYGGIDIVFGHANYCVAIPAAKHYPILVDMAAVECGGVEGQADILTGRRLPAGIFIDEDGKTVEDASAWGTMGYGLASGGQMMRSWKELCLVVSIEALAGALSGMQCALDLNTPEDPSVPVRTPKGQFVLALDIERFTSLVEFTAKIDRMIDHAKASRPAATQGAVRVPGERGYALADRQAREGISYEDAIWERGCRAFRRAGVDLIAITRNTLT